jgi:hypothetical protein
MLKSLFCNLQLNSNNVHCDILQYYNSVFIPQVDELLEEFRLEDDHIVKKRNMSMPDNMQSYHFEKESAFSNETILYEPLKKTIFSTDTLGFSSNRFTDNRFISQSPLCSPLINKTSMSATSLSRTPRTNRVLNSYLEIEKTSMAPQISNRNVFKGRILERLSSGHNRNSLCKFCLI